MARPSTRVAVTASRNVASACGTAACWILWVLLAVSAGFLVLIHQTRVIPVPDFILRRLEARFEVAQLQPRFGSTRFDPTGTLVLESVRIHSPLFSEPIASARAVVLNLDFWAVLIGDFDVDAIEIAGLELHCPAMFSPSGTSLPIVREFHATILRDGNAWSVPRADFKIGAIITSIKAEWDFRSAVKSGLPARPAEWMRKYFETARLIANQWEKLEALHNTHLDAKLEFRNDQPVRITIDGESDSISERGLVLSGVHFRIQHEGDKAQGQPLSLDVTADSLLVENRIELLSPRIHATGKLGLNPLAFIPGPIEIAAGKSTWGIAHVEGLIFRSSLEALPIVEGELSLALDGSRVRVVGSLDPRAGSLTSRVIASLDPVTLNNAVRLAAARTKGNTLRRLGFDGPVELGADIQLAGGWKFTGAQARFRALDANILGVKSSVASGTVDATPLGMFARDLLLVAPQLRGEGEYEMSFPNKDFRFLIRGRVFPEQIDPWFTAWWPRFWSRFAFAENSPPDLDLVVGGRWGDRTQTLVAGSVRAGPMTLRSLPFDRVSTRLFIRDEHYDVVHLTASVDDKILDGSFTQSDRQVGDLSRRISFDLNSTLEFPRYARLAGPEVLEVVTPFHFEGEPQLKINGGFAWSKNRIEEDLTVVATSTGVFRFFEFPIENTSFALRSKNGTVNIEGIKAELASGKLEGVVESVPGPPERTVKFSATLTDASIDQLTAAYRDFKRRSDHSTKPTPAESESVIGGRGLITGRLEATGLASDIWSFNGKGTAVVTQGELGRIRLLGPLSKLFEGTIFNFSSFKLTDANTLFELKGDTLEFGKLELTGPSAQIRSFGTYKMPTSALDFNTTLFPFRESTMPVIGLIGLVLEPFSRALEVRLTGTLEGPQWTFAAGASVPARETAPPRGNVPPEPPVP